MIYRVATFLLATSLCSASDEALLRDRSQTVKRKLSRSSKSKKHVQELKKAGIFKYLGRFPPIEVADYTDSLGFTKFTWDRQIESSANGPSVVNGPACIIGTHYSAYSRPADAVESSDDGRESDNLLIFLQGGGACWEDFSFCNVFAESLAPFELLRNLPNNEATGIFNFAEAGNPFKEYNTIYAPYCSGDAWTGDNFVVDSHFENDQNEIGGRVHRGLRNLSVTLELAKHNFPHAKSVTLMGHSAGGVGASAFGAALVREIFGSEIDLTVFNDAGPVAVDILEQTGDAQKKTADWWGLENVYPPSCVNCNNEVFVGGSGIGFIDWYLERDTTVRMAYASTLWDWNQRFYLRLFDPTLTDQLDVVGAVAFQTLLSSTFGVLSAKYPERFNTFLAATFDAIQDLGPGGVPQLPLIFAHGLVQKNEFYDDLPTGFPSLSQWTADFIERNENWESVLVVDPVCAVVAACNLAMGEPEFVCDRLADVPVAAALCSFIKY